MAKKKTKKKAVNPLICWNCNRTGSPVIFWTKIIGYECKRCDVRWD